MINFILVSDEHRECANWKLFKDYHRTNLKDAIDHFLELTPTDQKPYLIHLGDMVHSHKPPTSVEDPRGLDTLKELQQDFTTLTDKVVPLFINGNHDNRHGLYNGPTVPEYLQSFVDLSGTKVQYDSALNLFKIYADFSKKELLAVAYGYPVKGAMATLEEEYFYNLSKSFDNQKPPKFLFTHIPADGVTVGNYEVSTKFTYDYMQKYLSETVIFSGDIHKEQKYGCINYVGSPYDTRSRETIEDVVDFNTSDWVGKYKELFPSFTMVSYDESTKKVSVVKHPAKYVCLDVIGNLDINRELNSVSELENYLVGHTFVGPVNTMKLKAKVNIRMAAKNKEIFYSKGEAIDVTTGILSQHPNILAADTSVTFGDFVSGVFLPEMDNSTDESSKNVFTSDALVHNPRSQYYEYKHSISRKFSQEDWRNVEQELGVKEI